MVRRVLVALVKLEFSANFAALVLLIFDFQIQFHLSERRTALFRLYNFLF